MQGWGLGAAPPLEERRESADERGDDQQCDNTGEKTAGGERLIGEIEVASLEIANLIRVGWRHDVLALRVERPGEVDPILFVAVDIGDVGDAHLLFFDREVLPLATTGTDTGEVVPESQGFPFLPDRSDNNVPDDRNVIEPDLHPSVARPRKSEDQVINRHAARITSHVNHLRVLEQLNYLTIFSRIFQ